MRSRRRLVIVAFLVIIACLLLGACDGSHKNKEELPLKPWEDYVIEVSSAIDRQYMGISTKRPVSFEIKLNATDDETGDIYECSLALNLNLTGRSGQQGSLRVSKINGLNKKVLLDVYNSDEILYWCLWKENEGEYEKVVFDHAPLIYTIIKSVGFLGEDIDYSTLGSLFEAMGKVFFSDGTVNNAEHTKFAFDFDLKKGLDSSFSRKIFGDLPEVLQKLFFSIADVENYEDMLFKTPSLKGVVNIDLNEGIIDRIYCDALNYYDARQEVSKTLKVDAPFLKVANENINISEFQPDSDDYIKGRLSDVTATGKVKFENSVSNKTQMEYDYEFNAKIDLLDLFANDGDFSALEDDNFFHFRVMHKCTQSCGAFCNDKYDKAKGAVLDVAFSPKDFGNYNIYISVGVRAFLGSRVVSQWTNIESLIRNQIPEYLLAVISSDALTMQLADVADGSGVSGDGKSLIEEILISLAYTDSSLSLPISAILQIAGFDENTSDKIMTVFEGENYSIDTVRLEQNYLRWNVNVYDVKRSAIHLYGYDVSGTKQYTTLLWGNAPALEYEYQGQDIIDGDGEHNIVNIYSDKYEDGVLFDAQTSICGAEIEDIIGSRVKATAEDIYGDKFDCELFITGYSQIDPLKIGWQEISLYALPVGRGIIEGRLWEAIRSQSWSKWLCMRVKTYIYIDRLLSVDFNQPKNNSYMQGERFSFNNQNTPEIITAQLTYEKGKVKTRIVRATNTDDLFIYDYIGNKYVKCDEDIVMNFYLFGSYRGIKLNIASAKDKKLTLTNDELSLEINETGYSSDLRIAIMSWTLADGSTSEARLPLDNIKINGLTINEQNDIFYRNPTSSTVGIVFRTTGRYSITYECDGLSAVATLFITPKTQQVKKSEYAINGTSNIDGAHFFVGYTYSFDAEIVNTYHGEEGAIAKIDLQIRRGKVNDSGNLMYETVSNPQDYFSIEDTLINNQSKTLPYEIELPPTIYKNIQLRVKVNFLKSGYYRVRISLGGKNCDYEFNVESYDN